MIKNLLGIPNYRCQLCGSENTKKFFRDKQTQPTLEKIIEESQILKVLKDNLFNRKNGKCLDCGLIQSFNLLTNANALILYQQFGEFDVGHEFQHDILPQKCEEYLNTKRFGRRIEFYKNYFKNLKPSRVGMLRYWNGILLKMFHDEFKSETFGYEYIDSCRKSAKNKIKINDLTINYQAKIVSYELNSKLDILIDFHMLCHSVNIHNDIQKLISMVKPGGYIIFMDEIMSKRKNPAHMVHFNENNFISLLKMYFKQVERIDGIGETSSVVSVHTIKKDNPDFIVRVL